MSPTDMGIYGLMTTAIGLSLYLLGMDFYMFNTREILSEDKERIVLLIRDQIVFHGVAYIFLLPLLLIIFMIGFLPWNYLGLFYLLVVLEHVSQELQRLLITLSKPTMANIILFFRSGLWVYAVIAVGFYYKGERTLTYIWYGWIIGIIINLVFGAYAFRKMKWRSVIRQRVDWDWIRKGVLISLPFLGATLFLKTVEFSDRYFIRINHGDAMVGVYTFYANITNAIQTFVFAGIIMILQPKIVAAYQNKKFHEYKLLMRRMSLGVILGVMVLSFLAYVGIFPILGLIGKQIYLQYNYAYDILLIAIIANILSQIPHYVLYVRKMDKAIVFSSFAALFISVSMNAILVPRYDLVGAAISNLCAMVSLGVVKCVMASKALIDE
jgi:O-antigen/teichoic acid export membrane protein